MNGNDSQSVFDVNVQQTEAAQNLVRRLRCERVEARTGNATIDQLVPWYFGLAFAFVFTYMAGMPDMTGVARQPRYRRFDNAPRMDTDQWVQVVSRRVEASVSRDWMFGLVTYFVHR